MPRALDTSPHCGDSGPIGPQNLRVPTVEIGGVAIDYRDDAGGRPPVVFLHEGLGSIELWRSFPDDVRVAAGHPRTIVYSRPGYGHSGVVAPPWPVTYMHRQALEVLPDETSSTPRS